MALAWANPNRKRFKRSQTEERRVAGLLGGRALARSGAVKMAPKGEHAVTQDGDFRTRLLHAEHKRTEKDQLTVEWAWLPKVIRGARACMKAPALVLLFETLQGEARDWIFLELAYFQQISGCLDDPDRFQGDMRSTSRGSLILKAPAMAALMPTTAGVVPTMMLEWQRPGGSHVWVGSTVAQCTPWLVETDDAPTA